MAPGVNRRGPENRGAAAVIYTCRYFLAPKYPLFLGLKTSTWQAVTQRGGREKQRGAGGEAPQNRGVPPKPVAPVLCAGATVGPSRAPSLSNTEERAARPRDTEPSWAWPPSVPATAQCGLTVAAPQMRGKGSGR